MKVFMFPGQGSQARGMGGDLFDEYAELTQQADQLLGYSIKQLCLEDPRRELNKTEFTQPALYVVNALSYLKKVAETGSKPDFVIGHSLGEFDALFAAECYDFVTGLQLVKKRGELMSQATGGGMAAILNASRQQIEEILQKNALNNIDLANYNTLSQIVISGSREEIGKAEAFFQSGEILYYPLNTSGAFHSRFMLPSKEKFEAYIRQFEFSDPQIPVIANVTARPYQSDAIVDNLSSQIASTVRWSDSVLYLLEQAQLRGENAEFEEIGHGDVLTKIVKKLQEEAANLPRQQAEEQSHSTTTVGASPEANAVAGETVATPVAAQVEQQVNEWNRQYGIGTKVKSTLMDSAALETRTEAMVLFGHRAAVYIKGYNGYFDLDELQPVQ